MIYCDLIDIKDNNARYWFSCGKGEKGIIVFPLNLVKPYEIEKQQEIKLSSIWIDKLFAKYIKVFQNGIAKEKISYEC